MADRTRNQKMERERLQNLKLKAEKEKAEKQKDSNRKGRGKGKVYERRPLKKACTVDDSGQRHVTTRRVTAESRTCQKVAGTVAHVEMQDMLNGSSSQLQRSVHNSDGWQHENVEDNESTDHMSVDDDDKEEDGNHFVPMQVEVRRGKQGKFIKNPNARNKREEDDSWLLKEPIDGGPTVRGGGLIPSFLGHIASDMSSLESRAALKCHSRPELCSELGKWYRKMSPTVKAIVDSSGLVHLPQSMFESIDIDLISAFIERWQPDTNSFHLPFGEMTILLHDVYHILGIPVEGEMVRMDGQSAQLKAATSEVFGLALTDLTTEWYTGGGVNASRLVEKLSGKGVADCTRACGWIFVLLGSTLFVDKSGMMVRAGCLLECKEDVHSVHTYSWGSGTLANMYRHLGQASRRDAKGIGGCLSLLQAWIYEYFPVFRPHARFPTAPGSPRITAWKPRQEAKDRLPQLRQVIDQLIVEEILWLPYGLDPASAVPRTLYTGCIRYRDIVEPYMPSRCVRQLGYVQGIPSPITRPDKHRRPYNIKLYSVEFSPLAAEDAWRSFPLSSVLSVTVLQPSRLDPTACVEGYIRWYYENSHPRLLPGLPERPIPPHSNMNYWINRYADFGRQSITRMRLLDSDIADELSTQFENLMRDFYSTQ